MFQRLDEHSKVFCFNQIIFFLFILEKACIWSHIQTKQQHIPLSHQRYKKKNKQTNQLVF